MEFCNKHWLGHWMAFSLKTNYKPIELWIEQRSRRIDENENNSSA